MDEIREFSDQTASTSITFMDDDSSVSELVAGQSDNDNEKPETAATADRDDSSLTLELLRDGLSFDLIGLAPGTATDAPATEHYFDITGQSAIAELEPVWLAPGKHLAGGRTSLPVLGGLLSLARDIVLKIPGVEAVIWPPAKSVIGKRFFESTTTAWLEGGAFPALGLTAFETKIDGALQSVGLEFLIGQELRIEPPLSTGKSEATRLAIRLVNHLVLLGGLEHSERVTAPDGAVLSMQPSQGGKIVRVWSD